jgi:signal peptidase I
LTKPAKKTWKNEHVQTAIVIVVIVGIIFGLWFGGQLVLNTKIPPALAVVSGSMCITYDDKCNGWLAASQPFDRTLHRGDLIIIQGVDPQSLNTNYPNSDIIVFHRPDNPSELIVHRIVATTTINGTLYFFTKGDGNSPPDTWPKVPQTYEYDPWISNVPTVPQGAVSQNLIEGKVVMRIPWLGWIPIIMQEAGANSTLIIPVVVILVILLIIVQFSEPLLKRRKSSNVEHKRGTE